MFDLLSRGVATGVMATGALCVCAVIGMSPAFAADLGSPDGPVLLDVSGDIGATNNSEMASLDLDMLMALEATTYETTTIWTEGTQAFTGVTLGALMEALGVEGGTIKATAINDYSVEIPFEDATEGTALIAYMRNDEIMSVRDKGPLWVVYNYDSDTRFQSEVYYSRSIWQLNRLEVSP